MSGALQFLHGVEKKRSIMFVLSDFLAEGWETAFALTSKKDDLVSIRIQDPVEVKMPAIGFIRATDIETGKEMYIDYNKELVAREAEQYAIQKDAFIKTVVSSGAHHIDVMTDVPYDRAMLAFFQKRKRSITPLENNEE